jgi:hypothetical protein
MSRPNRTGKIQEWARQAAAHMKPAAARVRPLARSTVASAGHQMHSTRAWAAPRVERTGQLLQDNVAPKVSDLLSSAARRLEPGKPRRWRWRIPAGLATVTAVAGAAAAYARNRKPDSGTPAAATAGDVAASKPGNNGQATTSTSEVDRQTRVS